MKRNKHIGFTLLLAFCLLKSQAQINLVPNGDFEDTEACLSGPNTYPISRYWFNPQNRPIALDNPCFYGSWRTVGQGTFGLNGSKCGFFETYGYFTQLNVSHHRVYLTVQLKEPLVKGQQYYFEMSFRTLDTVPSLNRVTTDFTDGHQLAFSKDFPIYDWNIPNGFIPLAPVLSHKVVKDYNWHKLKGCFEAKGGEQFLLIGNFMDNSQTNRTPTGKKSLTLFIGSNHIADNVILVPVKVALKDTVVCKDQFLTLNVGNKDIDSMRYLWHDGTTTPQYQVSKSERISVQVIYPAENCIATGSINVKTLSADYQPLAFDTTLCKNEKITFTAGTGLVGETITWQNGSKDRKIDVNTEGVYWANIKNQCASWTDTFRLRINHCGFEVYVPNAFSPNGDGVNDDFHPFFKTDFIKIENYDFHIYNRWGSLIFNAQNLNDGWDGTFQGKPCEMGVYIWTLRVRVLLNGKEQVKEFSGDVAIIR
jgi:gliding motility-associated-like protein